MSTKVLEVRFNDMSLVQKLHGPHDENLKRIEKELDVELFARGETFRITGEENCVDLVFRLFEDLYQVLQSGFQL